jgi:hypothetical protein
MSALEAALIDKGMSPVYAFSKRESVASRSVLFLSTLGLLTYIKKEAKK